MAYFPVIPDKPKGGGENKLKIYRSPAKLPDWEADSPVWPIKVNQWFSRFHSGIDLECRYREPIYAAQDGVVSFVGWLRGYGLVVKISHPGGFLTLYGHNDQVFVKTQQNVKLGATIASCGTTGRSSGTHLHWEIIHENQWLNPWGYIKP